MSVVSLHLVPTISKTTREAKADKLEADKSAAISAELTVKIEAKIEAEAKWLFFHVKAGANATVASAKSIDVGAGIKGEMTFAPPKKEGEALDFSGDVICTGAAVYLGVYSEAKINNCQVQSKNVPQRRAKMYRKATKKLHLMLKNSCLSFLFESVAFSLYIDNMTMMYKPV